MANQYSTFLATARTAAKQAAQILRSQFGETLDVKLKDDGSLVTGVDLESEERIRSIISEQHPEHAILGEEQGRDSDAQYTWIVDPLDGTTNYVNNFSHYGVSIALTVDNRPVVGVVAHPYSDDIYTAVAGEGAQRNGDPINVSTSSKLSDSNVLFGISPPTANDDQFMQLFQQLIRSGETRGVRRLGSGACDLSLVADGTFDCFVDKYTSPWDVAAGILLVSEAGGRVTNWERNPIDLSVGKNEVHLIATNGEVHADVQTTQKSIEGNTRKRET